VTSSDPDRVREKYDGDDVHVLAEEQAALRRVATLVARGAPPDEVFAAAVEEVGRVLPVDRASLGRYEAEGAITYLANWGARGRFPPIDRPLPLGGTNLSTRVFETGRSARIDNYGDASGSVAVAEREGGVRSAVGAPIVVEGRLWGMMAAGVSGTELLPADLETRLSSFTELLATAIANAESRAGLARMVEEQAALRRVAMLVAEASPPERVMAKVAEEVATLLGTHVDAAILRYGRDRMATVMAVWGEQPPTGIRVDARLPVDGSGITARVFHEKRPVRVDNYTAADGAIADHAKVHGIRSAVGSPILVQGGLWGAIVVAHYEPAPFPADTEQRVAQFTELVATAIANAAARAEAQRLADEQAALRRVATLVAEGRPLPEVFEAVSVEVAQILGGGHVALARYASPHELFFLALHGGSPGIPQVGMRIPLDGDSVSRRVLRTGRSSRIDWVQDGTGPAAELARRANLNVTVGAPITVEGRVWGVVSASWVGEDQPPAEAEERLGEFAALLDTVIANAHSRDQLTASRARVLTAGNEARRQVVRDLHDGAQQRLVQTVLTLKLARHALAEDTQHAGSLLSEALESAEQGNAALRELSHGILPSVLTRGGVRAGVQALVSRLSLPVEVQVTGTRLPPDIEANAYFIVAEALTNAVKHAHATSAEVTAAVADGVMRLEIRDDGVGGADPDGHGLMGISDRVAALEGRLRIDSPGGAGTVVTVELPVPA
jgi:signal transduction histidine kinase